jgi:hypothetical protein
LNDKLQVESTIHFKRRNRGEKVIQVGEAPPEPPGRVPRISRMMALAIWFNELIRKSEVKNFAELAAMGQVCRTRVSQIMNLLLLAPDIQEEILFLPRIERGKEPIQEHELRQIAAVPDWRKQRRIWKASHR